MPNNGLEKIKLAHNAPVKHRSWVVILVLGAAFLTILVGLSFLLNQDKNARLRTSQRTFILDVAQTPDEQEKGLGGRQTLATDHGMIFIYPTEDTRCFWMKDMRFSLDMIWLDASYKVTHVESLVTPETYPMSFCGKNAQYIIELPAGAAAQSHIAPGQILSLKHMP